MRILSGALLIYLAIGAIIFAYLGLAPEGCSSLTVRGLEAYWCADRSVGRAASIIFGWPWKVFG
jgi:hypothetical protein